jgi:murein DD-endopeptidase MepM/ murein hydrolase activator NlpD
VKHRRTAVVLAVVLVGLGPPAGAAEIPGDWSPPVGGAVVRGFEPPGRPFGPRHLGLDYAVPPGTEVRAAGDGVVAFAGRVGRAAFAVAVDHAGARRTTYAYLGRLAVRPGTPVRRGDVLGESGATGPGHGGSVLHFGYRVAGQPTDPAPLFAAPPPRISLAPLDRPACPNRRSLSAVSR